MVLYIVSIGFVFKGQNRHVTICATASEQAAEALYNGVLSLNTTWTCHFTDPWGPNSTFVDLPDDLMRWYYNARAPHCDLKGERVEHSTMFLLRSADVVRTRV